MLLFVVVPFYFEQELLHKVIALQCATSEGAQLTYTHTMRSADAEQKAVQKTVFDILRFPWRPSGVIPVLLFANRAKRKSCLNIPTKGGASPEDKRGLILGRLASRNVRHGASHAVLRG